MNELVKTCVLKKCGLWVAQSVSAKALEICDCVRAQASRDEL